MLAFDLADPALVPVVALAVDLDPIDRLELCDLLGTIGHSRTVLRRQHGLLVDGRETRRLRHGDLHVGREQTGNELMRERALLPAGDRANADTDDDATFLRVDEV